MCGVIVSFLLYPTIPGMPFSTESEGQVLHTASKIISLGANTNHSLTMAVRRYRWPDIAWLMERGATLDTDALALFFEGALDAGGLPPLELCQLLLDRGVDVNACIWDRQAWQGTPTVAASLNGELPFTQLCMGAGRNIGIMQWNSTDTLSAGSKPPEASNPRLGIDSESNNLDLDYSRHARYGTVLIEACARRGVTEICQLLVKHGADVHAVLDPKVGRFGTALIAACAYHRTDICKILLDRDVDVTTISWRRPTLPDAKPILTTALITASGTGSLEICRLLLARGSDVNARPPYEANGFKSQGTALIAAASGGHIKVCHLLLDHGSDVNSIALCARYSTALIAAASRKKWKVCQLLLDHGADITSSFLNILH
jgi:ankyrin repeat protein